MDKIIGYNHLCQIIKEQEEEEPGGDHDEDEQYWGFSQILDHQGPLKTSDPDYNGSKFNLLVQWDDDSQTYKPLSAMIKDAPAAVAKYAKDHGMLDQPGWKSLKWMAKREQKLHRLVKQSKKAKKTGIIYQFGVQVPCSVKGSAGAGRKERQHQVARCHEKGD